MHVTRPIVLTPERVERFWSKVEIKGPDECWPWRSRGHEFGYGYYEEWRNNERSLRVYAHRLALAISGTPVDGLVVRHDCDNPPCCNPAHLRTGDQSDNLRDAQERSRLDLSGLAKGWAKDYPPRDCADCGTTVSTGRSKRCGDCRKRRQREQHNAAQLIRRRAAAARRRAEEGVA